MIGGPQPSKPRPITDYIHMHIETTSGKIYEADVKPSKEFEGYTLDLANRRLYKDG